eukprot:UN13367
MQFERIYMIHCTRVVTGLAPIVYGQDLRKSPFVGSGQKTEIIQGGELEVPSEIIFCPEPPSLKLNSLNII